MTEGSAYQPTSMAISMAILFISSSFVSNIAVAESWILEPSVSLENSFDTNHTLTFDGERRIFTENGIVVSEEKSKVEASQTTVAAGLGFSRVNPASEIKGVIKAEGTVYAQDSDSKANNVELENTFNLVGFVHGEKRTLRSFSAFDVSYKRESLLRDIDTSTDVNDISVDPNEGVEDGLVRTNVNRDRIIINPRLDWNLSAISGLGVNYRFQGVTHSNDDGLPTTLSDYNDHEVTGTYWFQYSPIDKFVTTLSGFYYDATDEDADVNNESITEKQLSGENTGVVVAIGIDRQLSETSDISVRGGFRTTNIKTTDQARAADDGNLATVEPFTGDIVSTEEDTDGYIISLNGEKRTGLTRYSFRAGRNLYGSGVGEVVQADEFLVNVRHEYTELLSFFGRAKLFQNKTIRETEDSDRRYLSFEPGLSWNFKRWWNFDTNYRYRREKQNGNFSSAESHALIFGLRWSKPRNLN